MSGYSFKDEKDFDTAMKMLNGTFDPESKDEENFEDKLDEYFGK